MYTQHAWKPTHKRNNKTSITRERADFWEPFRFARWLESSLENGVSSSDQRVRHLDTLYESGGVKFFFMFAMARSSGKMREGGKERDQVNIITIGKKEENWKFSRCDSCSSFPPILVAESVVVFIMKGLEAWLHNAYNSTKEMHRDPCLVSGVERWEIESTDREKWWIPIKSPSVHQPVGQIGSRPSYHNRKSTPNQIQNGPNCSSDGSFVPYAAGASTHLRTNHLYLLLLLLSVLENKTGSQRWGGEKKRINKLKARFTGHILPLGPSLVAGRYVAGCWWSITSTRVVLAEIYRTEENTQLTREQLWAGALVRGKSDATTK